jgi:hypothetical protein
MGIETIILVFGVIVAVLIWRSVSKARNADRAGKSPADPTSQPK